MTVRAARIEIFGFGKSSGQRNNWKQLSIDCQRMQNRLWQIWLVHHAVNGSADKLREHFDRYNEWLKTKEGPKPEWSVGAFGVTSEVVVQKGKNAGKITQMPILQQSGSPESFYRILSAEFPGVNVRTRGLLTAAWQSKLSKRKSASGNLPGWVSILFANESLPSFTRPQPIPFDKDNAKLLKIDGKYFLEVRIERLADGKSVVERCELILGKRKTASVRSTVDKLLAGQWKWKGSNLFFDRGKWYAIISYEKPDSARVAINPDKVLYVRAGKQKPWRIHCDTRTQPFGGDGRHVEYARRTIQRERGQRKEHYRWAGSRQKGHGLRRAEAVWTKLSSRWKDFTKRYNNEVTTRLVRWAIANGVGRIVYRQPKDQQRDSRFLSNAGNDGHSQMSWDYFQFGTMLASKCEEHGVEYGAKPKKAKSAAGRVRGVRKTLQAVG